MLTEAPSDVYRESRMGRPREVGQLGEGSRPGAEVSQPQQLGTLSDVRHDACVMAPQEGIRDESVAMEELKEW